MSKRSMSDARHGDKASEEKDVTGRFAYEGLDRVLHERARLSLLTSLVTHPKGLTFNELKGMCSLTDGNLSRHLGLLEAEKMVKIEKEQDGNRMLTTSRMTAAGRKRYLAYLGTLEQVLRDAEASAARPSLTHALKPTVTR